MSEDPAPRATYRLQLNAGFTFDDAVRIAPYLSSLGVSHVYASPIQKARPGSAHGYDIVDHAQINPELGGEDGFRRFSSALSAAGLKLLLDIVPNHMGVGGSDNAWWLSTLEWGEQSPFARMFDIDWDRTGAKGKLVVPFLGKPYGEALRTGELQLRFDADEGSFSVWHWEHRFPVNPLDYRWILEWAQVAGGGGLDMRPLYKIAEDLRELAEAPRPVTREGRVERCERIKREIAAHAHASAHVRAAIDKAVAFACGDPRTPESFGALHRILERQSYRPAYWRVASTETNYRRFFDINSLAGVRAEDEAVFEATHALIFRLIAQGHVHGLRIDHVDGLADPKRYLQRLRDRLGTDFYILVEKILEPGEPLRDWPIAGTTGYETMAQLDGVFIARESEAAFSRLYEDVEGRQKEFTQQLRSTKLELLRGSFGSELESLVWDLKHAADADLVTSDFTADALRRALWEVIAALPVYRTYLDADEPKAADRALIAQAIADAKSTTSLDTSAAHDLIESFLLSPRDPERSPSRQILLDRITRRFQQLTGPVMAKSLEDTLFYRFARFVALNEVGGDPTRFGLSVEDFHAMNCERAGAWPHALVATATHDMKRGEDVRARLAALSHAPDVWTQIVSAAERVEGEAPDANDRYMLLQTIVGAWPTIWPNGDPVEAHDVLRERVTTYAIKALRESKRRSSWTSPDEAYEESARQWLQALLGLDGLQPVLAKHLPAIARAGEIVSLSRLVVKLTVPGVPDTYQGCEDGDFSLVDPDNRRKVDFAAHAASLDAASTGFGALKQALTATLLRDRAHAPRLYSKGAYEARPAPRPGWLAFSRRCEREHMFVAALTRPFEAQTSADVMQTLLHAFSPADGWSNLLQGHALDQRKHGGAALPAIVLRKSS